MKMLNAFIALAMMAVSPAFAIEWKDIDPGDQLWEKSVITANRRVVVVSKANGKVLVRYDDGTKDYVDASLLMTESERSAYNGQRVGAAVAVGIGILSILGDQQK